MDFSRDRFASRCGIKLEKVSEGHAIARMKVDEFHLNGAGVVHGGAIFTLADFAFAAASNSYGRLALAINASISFFRALPSGILIAEAKEVSRSKRLATYEVRVISEAGDIVALFHGTVYIKG